MPGKEPSSGGARERVAGAVMLEAVTAGSPHAESRPKSGRMNSVVLPRIRARLDRFPNFRTEGSVLGFRRCKAKSARMRDIDVMAW